MRAGRDKMNVRLHREARGGKDSISAQRLVAIESDSFDQLQPLFDAARSRAVPIMVQNSFAPGDSKRGIFTARKNGRVFDRDMFLIVVAIQRPGLQLAASEFSFVHEQVKRMPVMVELRANGVKTGDEFGLVEQRLFGGGGGHRSNSPPS